MNMKSIVWSGYLLTLVGGGIWGYNVAQDMGWVWRFAAVISFAMACAIVLVVVAFFVTAIVLHFLPESSSSDRSEVTDEDYIIPYFSDSGTPIDNLN